ncbi:hypothetical protein T265_12093 [Opisthorchis viverrini]|uniref:Uncharacterized protein n=1 Tax=Opisthorchis viverrini TaxID=6198 RepID=A0A074YW73_OPIVI|nr:hypothetical protein T265_12093 [Opisthorchis viverrini]KER18933.1 hypothetical protein T265_12093 [Opisthorchis viverrini]
MNTVDERCSPSRRLPAEEQFRPGLIQDTHVRINGFSPLAALSITEAIVLDNTTQFASRDLVWWM